MKSSWWCARAVRGVADQAFSARAAAPQPRHVRLGRRLVEEDQFRRVEPALLALPVFAFPGDVGTLLFGCMQRLFLYVSPIRVNTQWIAPIVQPSSSRCLISSSVTSGCFSTSFRIRSPYSGSSRALRPQNRYLARRSPVRFLCANSFFTIPSDTLKRLATSSLVPSFSSQALTIRSLKSSDIGFFMPVTYTKYLSATTIFEILYLLAWLNYPLHTPLLAAPKSELVLDSIVIATLPPISFQECHFLAGKRLFPRLFWTAIPF